MTASNMIQQWSGAELVLYPSNLDPISSKPLGSSEISTSRRISTQLIDLETEKMMGQSGTWRASLKVPRSSQREFEESIADGDWADVLFQRGDRRFHVMRGIVRSIDEERSASNGPETCTYSVQGWDHQAVFDLTRVWFSTFSEENVVPGAALRAGTLVGRLVGLGGVRETVTGLLLGFLTEMNNYGRGVWTLPNQIPGQGGRSFAQSCALLYDYRVDSPARLATGVNLITPDNQSLWQLASEWSDPEWNEIWCDLSRSSRRAPAGDVFPSLDQEAQYEPFVLGPDDALDPSETQMALFLRRRPFPTMEDAAGMHTGPWTRLQTATILPQEIEQMPTHRSGDERFNVFEVLPPSVQEIAPQSLPYLAPLVDRDDISRRGVRPLSMSSRYIGNVAKGVSYNELAESQRRMLRDWHCLNPRFLSGMLNLQTLRPGIRVGQVACVTQNRERLRGRDAEDDITFYVESVKHQWRAGSGNRPHRGKTSLGVTRGFRGGDDALFEMLTKVRARYTPLLPSKTAAAQGSATSRLAEI